MLCILNVHHLFTMVAYIFTVTFEKKKKSRRHLARKVATALIPPVVYSRFYTSYPAAPI